MEKPQTG